MKKIVILILILAIAGILSLFFFKLGFFQPKNNSAEIKIDSPFPDEIIKGPIFNVQGTIKTDEKTVALRIFDKNQNLVKTEIIELSPGPDGQKKFDAKIDASPAQGDITIEIGEAKIPIKIIISL